MEQSPAIARRARRTGELVAMFDSQDAESSVPEAWNFQNRSEPLHPDRQPFYTMTTLRG